VTINLTPVPYSGSGGNYTLELATPLLTGDAVSFKIVTPIGTASASGDMPAAGTPVYITVTGAIDSYMTLSVMN
jgi:hypothetical protein